MPAGGYHSREIRVQVLTLWAVQLPISRICHLLDLPDRTVREMIKKAQNCGYNPEESIRVRPEFIEDGARSGRPKGVSEAIRSTDTQ